MDNDNLVRMVNQIGQFFEAMPDREPALEGIATHVRKFWAPRMREQLQAHYTATGGAGLKAIVIEALLAHSILHRAVSVDPTDTAGASRRHDFDGASEA